MTVRCGVVVGLLVAVLCGASGCYHMRLLPVPLESADFKATQPMGRAVAEFEKRLLQDGFLLEAVDAGGGVILTGYRFFYNDTGFGQPAGGRDYYYRLKVNVTPEGQGVTVRLTPFDLELRTFYVYDHEGRLDTLKKRYPYEVYPGMFELEYLKKELQRVKALLAAER
ncbi:hypothetical protein [Geomobilimonas luticola]|uniref:DUF4136 domain-containing protein n=1 Tax=Geomobilimonas luticola TaxID=1114878 RepID=A0ABS5S9L9_9BACT|nr:hypothetical protein [Geomobilimonas luticola]MBT0651845.1 hypothetical protein [Geomobilimonas luticola]